MDLDHSLSTYDGLEASSANSHKIEYFCLMLNCTSPCIYKSSVSTYQVFLIVVARVTSTSLLERYLIIRKHNVLKHHDRAQINITDSGKNITQSQRFSVQAVWETIVS
jgi:hypothetical protein